MLNLRQIILSLAGLSLLFASHTALAVAPDETALRQHAAELHGKIVSLDSHTDAPLAWAEKGYTLGGDHPNCVTLDKMERGGLDAQYLAAYVASDYKKSGRRGVYALNAKTYAHRKAEALKLLNLAKSEIAANSDRCGLATTSADIRRLKSEGKRAFLLGVENGICLGNDVDMVDSLAAMGVTYITLTHVYDNQLCTTSSRSVHKHGLTRKGREVVRRMNELGVVVDLSHASERTFYDVLDITTKPVVCSHSGVKKRHVHDRNLTDDQLLALARNGGVIQIVAYKPFIGKGKDVGVKHLVDHIDHAVRVAGIDHVGIGTDFDGGGKLAGLADDADFMNITVELLRRGYSDDDIAKIMGANYLRVLDAQK